MKTADNLGYIILMRIKICPIKNELWGGESSFQCLVVLRIMPTLRVEIPKHGA
jgi:hypothetical protein